MCTHNDSRPISLFTLFLLLMICFILYHAPLRPTFCNLGKPKRVTTVLAAWVRVFILRLFIELVFISMQMFAAIILTSIVAAITVFRRKISVVSNIITSAVFFTHEYPHSLWCDRRPSWIKKEGIFEEVSLVESLHWKDLSWILVKISTTINISHYMFYDLYFLISIKDSYLFQSKVKRCRKSS